MADTTQSPESSEVDEDRRDFLIYATAAVAATGAAAFAWPLVDSMNPSAEVLALSTTEVDLSSIEEGQSITVVWRGKPVFVRRRTKAEIDAAVKDDTADLRQKENDADRTQKPEWLIMIGICTHLGCIPLGQKSVEPKGEFGGWFCPCHGSHYDTSGRIRKGPAPFNLEVPLYEFLDDKTIRIG
ncbi:MAG: ubiquinol-cytochrome c reductase iron-sulfur subunit [Alphaproteobacteria bacterium]|nr:ubiquinol-cytochrome c reductase iron-sulfur subunit [Alphaproteobacteria bacterium]